MGSEEYSYNKLNEETSDAKLGSELDGRLGAFLEAKGTLADIVLNLRPYVVLDFNRWLEREVNPNLPQGYSLKRATLDSVPFENGYFKFLIPSVMTPNGPTREPPLEVIRSIRTFLEAYTLRNEDWTKVHLTFHIPK